MGSLEPFLRSTHKLLLLSSFVKNVPHMEPLTNAELASCFSSSKGTHMFDLMKLLRQTPYLQEVRIYGVKKYKVDAYGLCEEVFDSPIGQALFTISYIGGKVKRL